MSKSTCGFPLGTRGWLFQQPPTLRGGGGSEQKLLRLSGACCKAYPRFGHPWCSSFCIAERQRRRLVAEVWSEIAQQQAAAGSREEPSRKVPRLAESYTYSCPECHAEVSSTARSGRVDQRRSCGHRFRVQDGVVVNTQQQAARHIYSCPECDAEVTSASRSGRVDQRRGCGHRFRVQCVVASTYQHACPNCGTLVRSSRPFGRIRAARSTPAGRQCERRSWEVPAAA